MEFFCSLVITLFSTYYKLYFTATKNAFENKQQFLGFRIYKEIPTGKKSPNLTFAISLDQLQMFSRLYKNLDVLNLTFFFFFPAMIGTLSNLSAKTPYGFHVCM